MAQRPKNKIFRIFLSVLWVCVVGGLFGAPPPAMAQPARAPGKALAADGGYVPDEVLVKVSVSASSVQRKSLGKVGKVTDSGLPSQRRQPAGGQSPEAGTVQQAIEELQKQPGVIYAEPNYYVTAQDVIPNDPAFPNQYGLDHINAPAAWEITRGAAGVTIAIVDSGVDFHQPDLAAKLVVGANFISDPDANPQDDYGHGTMVASLAAAMTNNRYWDCRRLVGGADYAGQSARPRWQRLFSWRSHRDHLCRRPQRPGDQPQPGRSRDPYRGCAYSVRCRGLCRQAGVVVVAAAGNSYGGSVFFPAACPGALAITATD